MHEDEKLRSQEGCEGPREVRTSEDEESLNDEGYEGPNEVKALRIRAVRTSELSVFAEKLKAVTDLPTIEAILA